MEPTNNSAAYNLRYGRYKGRSNSENDTLSGNPKKKQTKPVKTILETTDKTKSNQNEQKQVESDSLIKTTETTVEGVEALAQVQRCSVGQETTTGLEVIDEDRRFSVVHGEKRAISNDAGSETSYINEATETPETESIVQDIAQDQRNAAVQRKNRAISSDTPKTKKRKTEHRDNKNQMIEEKVSIICSDHDNNKQILEGKMAKEQTNSHNKIRNCNIPMLRTNCVQEMFNGERGYCHEVKDKECAIPYCLPHEYMHLLSCCSFITNGTSHKITMTHINLCQGTNCKEVKPSNAIELESIPKIEIDSDNFNNLAKEPEFFSNGRKLLLRMQKNVATVACICGHKAACYKIEHQHFKTCKYLKEMEKAFAKGNGPTQKLSPMKNNCLPVVKSYFSGDGVERSTKLTDTPRHMYSKIDRKFDKYIPFGNDPVRFYIPRSDNVLQREMMKNFYEVDVFIASNIEEIRHVVKGKDRIRNDNWDGFEIQSSRYEI